MGFKDIGAKIQMTREEKGMSQEQLATALGCSQSALSNYEKGKRRLYLAQLEKISEVLEKPVEYFIENNNQVNSCSLTTEEHDKQVLKLLNTVYQLNDMQLIELNNYISYMRWKENN